MDSGETNAGVRYERRDIRLGCLLALMVVAVCVMGIVGYGVWRFFWWQAGVQQAAKRSPYPLAPGPSAQLPPEPRLEQLNRMTARESVEVDRRLAAKEQSLNSYGLTGEKGIVHIPIQQAIKAIAGQLPVRRQSQGQAAYDNGLIDSGESNSGRMFRGPLP